MGFSVSGSTALIFVAMFIAFGIFSSAASNGFERVSDAYHDDADRVLDQQNTDVVIASLSCSPTFALNVTNTGSTALSVSDTDVLLDNEFYDHTDFETHEVAGNATTDLWLPGENLTLANASLAPSRVKVVTGPGVSATEAC